MKPTKLCYVHLFIEKYNPPRRQNHEKSGPSAGVIAAAVIVPVVVIGAIIGAALVWKKRHIPGLGFPAWRSGKDDTAPLET